MRICRCNSVRLGFGPFAWVGTSSRPAVAAASGCGLADLVAAAGGLMAALVACLFCVWAAGCREAAAGLAGICNTVWQPGHLPRLPAMASGTWSRLLQFVHWTDNGTRRSPRLVSVRPNSHIQIITAGLAVCHRLWTRRGIERPKVVVPAWAADLGDGCIGHPTLPRWGVLLLSQPAQDFHVN